MLNSLYSTVRNDSGRKMTFGFLPPHGKSLDANEELTVFGDIREAIRGARGSEHSVARRDIIAFEAAITRGDLALISTPSPIIVDATTTASKMLSLDDGTLATADPDWVE